MRVEFLKRFKRATGLKNYGIAKELRALGISITVQAIDGYELREGKGMRLDVLAGLAELYQQVTGKPRLDVADWVFKEFGPKG